MTSVGRADLPHTQRSAYRAARGATLVAVVAMAAVAAPCMASRAVPQSLPAPAGSYVPGPATYGTATDPNVRIRMDDGVVLVGDVMYPTDTALGRRARGPFPVLLSQSPYNCQTTPGNQHGFGQFSMGDAAYWVSRGYLYAMVCIRGTGRSGGEFDFMTPRQARDGVELATWAAKLPSSDGDVGLIGCSYLGVIQLMTAAVLPARSPVKAMSPTCAGAEFYRGALLSGGMPTEAAQYLVAGAAGLIGVRAEASTAPLAADIVQGGEHAYVGRYWTERTPGIAAANIVRNKIPTLLVSGWLDMFPRGALDMYAYLQNAAAGRPVFAPMVRGQKTSPRYQLIMGPWGHGGGIDQAVQLEWFDTWLKGRRTRFLHTNAPLHVRQLGIPQWDNLTTYPMVSRYTPFYLSQGGQLAPQPAQGGADTISYTQPAVPGGSLSYVTTPFPHGATIAGPITASLVMGSTGKNLNIIATLEDVAPSGSTKVTQGNLVGSLRRLDPARTWRDAAGRVTRAYQTFARNEYLTGKSVHLEVELTPAVYSIAPGHALRLILTTQMPSSGCGGPLLGSDPCYPTVPQQRSLPGTYSVLRGTASLSAVSLPLLPFGCFAAAGGRGAQPDPYSADRRDCT